GVASVVPGDFGAAGAGAAYLDAAGVPDLGQGAQTWITCRMTHCFSLGHLMGIPGFGPLARLLVERLRHGGLRDRVNGGWFHAVSDDGAAPDLASGKSAYDHAFVMLAGASATTAGIPGGPELLADATAVYLDKFWDGEYGRPVDTWNADFTKLDPYRGVNATMHTLEAMLAVIDALPEGERAPWRERARGITQFAVGLAADHDGRLPEHFTADWVPDLELNKDRPGDQFKPYGATPGHGFEWARLVLHFEADSANHAAGGATQAADLLPPARALYARAAADSWDVDGAPGFVYTTDWSGQPVVRTRMHWVVCEGIATAHSLFARTGEPRFGEWYGRFWDYAREHLLDLERGSWHHELDEQNRPTATVWPGKPDIYHALQCALIPLLPLTPMLPAALLSHRVAIPGA
ncbi:MAG: AGE family epimerase/isomerase, partial [Promicromonosporaceae bacterium]|nr:AGE family epimerase/isomerase [Promicromonosporaceae bacterium]